VLLKCETRFEDKRLDRAPCIVKASVAFYQFSGHFSWTGDMLRRLIEYDRRRRGACVPASSDASSVRISLSLWSACLARVFKDRQSLMHATLLLLQIPSASWAVASYFVHVCTFCAIFFDAWLLISKLQYLESCEGISLAPTRALRWSHEDSWSKSFFFIGLLL
jgi:hypothetical protein